MPCRFLEILVFLGDYRFCAAPSVYKWFILGFKVETDIYTTQSKEALISFATDDLQSISKSYQKVTNVT